jgi:hypothetical protein
MRFLKLFLNNNLLKSFEYIKTKIKYKNQINNITMKILYGLLKFLG